jgi:hypothetical protein
MKSRHVVSPAGQGSRDFIPAYSSAFHGLRVGPPCGRAAPPVATPRRPVGAKDGDALLTLTENAVVQRPAFVSRSVSYLPPQAGFAPGTGTARAVAGSIVSATVAATSPARTVPKKKPTEPLCTVQWASFSSPKTQGWLALFLGAVFTCSSPDLYDPYGCRQPRCRNLLASLPLPWFNSVGRSRW